MKPYILKHLFLFLFLFAFNSLAQTEEEEDLMDEDLSQEEPQQVIIFDNPQNTPINEQIPTEVYGTPIPTRREQIIQERKKIEEETENLIRERIELMRIRDEKQRLKEIMDPLDKQPNVISDPRQFQEESRSNEEIKKPSQKKRPYFFSLGGGRLNFYNHSVVQSFFGRSGLQDLRYGPNPYNPYQYSGYGGGYNYGYYGGYNTSYLNNSFRDVKDFGKYVFSNYMWSASIGVQEGDRLSFEYKLTWSGHTMSIPDIASGESQFLFLSHTGILKYFLLSGILRPFLGLGVSFNQRFAVPPIPWGISSTYQSFYVGPVAGVEVLLGNKVAIGVMGRYSVNFYQLSSSRDVFYQSQNTAYFPTKIPEEMDITVIDVYLKYLF